MTKLTIIVYHYVRPVKGSKFPRLKALENKLFCKQLDYLQKKYTIISYEDFLNLINKKSKFRNPCLLTFDDGYKDHIKYVLPELKKRRIKGCFFPAVEPILKNKVLNVNKIQFVIEKEKNISKIFKNIFEYIEKKKIKNISYSKKNIIKIKKKFFNKDRKYDDKNTAFLKYLLQIYLSEEIRDETCNYLFKKYVSPKEEIFSKKLYMSTKDLKKLIKEKMYIGVHGFTHKHMNRLSYNRQLREIKRNIKFLKNIGLENKRSLMCYPYGVYNDNTIKILKKNNFIGGLTIKSGINKISSKKKFYNFKRIDTNEFLNFS